LLKHVVIPIATVGFVSFLDNDAARRDPWPMLAIAGAVWLLFANSVSSGGMVLWHERWLLRRAVVPAWLLLASAELVPIGVFGVHILLVHLALWASSISRGGTPIEIVLAGGIAVASGLGAGILAARLTEVRPRFASVLPKLLLASLVLTPVFYRLSALDGLEIVWAVANPLSVATELGRAGISSQAEALPRFAIPVAYALSGSILCWALFTLRVPATPFAEEHA
jgi:ABC-type polysaccharide/polyol phosphate export permease